MRTTIVLLSTIAVALAANCGQTPIKPNVTHVKVSGDKVGQFIVGGDFAVPYSWPWMVALCTKNWFGQCDLHCGGTIIAPGWVLTAGQCVYDNYKPTDWVVKAGFFDEKDTSTETDQVQKVGVKDVHLHPKFNFLHNSNDVALLELATPLVFNDHIQPVCLPKTDDVALTYPDDFWGTGWGSPQDNEPEEIGLHQINLPFVNTTTCQKTYLSKVQPDTMFCAGGINKATCYEDLGGPLVKTDASGVWFQYGIFSWTNACGAAKYPGIYTRVTAFCDWMNTATNGAAQCNGVL